MAIFTGHKQWWITEQAKRDPKPKKEAKPEINYQVTEKKYRSVERYTKEQRNFFVIYKTNVQEEMVRGFKIWEKANQRHLVNNDLGIKIYDRPDKIALQIPNDPDKRAVGVRLALAVAIKKGWNLDTMNITGTADFRKEVRCQVAEIKTQKTPKTTTAAELKPVPVALEPKQPISAVTQAVTDHKEAQDKRLRKDEITTIKNGLDATQVIAYAVEKHGVLKQHFTVTADNKIKDDRTRAKPKNVVDFLTKTCNVPIANAMPALQELYIQQQTQEAAPQMDISVCTRSNHHGHGGWVHQQPRTFTELVGLVKRHRYAGFTALKDDDRKVDNVVTLGNVAIFDIDNNLGGPQLTITQAQKLLSGSTYLLIPSKSHQQVKVKAQGGEWPATDRYRVIVPLNDSPTVDRDLYRLEMMQVAKQLGLAPYADPKALKDYARQYYPSPADAQPIINNTKRSHNLAPAKQWAIAALERLEKSKVAARKAVLDRALSQVAENRFDPETTQQYPFLIDVDAINELPLPKVYETMTGNKLTLEGSYLMGQGITPGTSQRGPSFTVFESGTQWIWNDFKSGENGNVLSFMEAMGQNAFQAAQTLKEHFGVSLYIDNLAYYTQTIRTVLEAGATNDRELEDGIKKITEAEYVRLGQDSITVADKTFKLNDLDLSHKEVIGHLRNNREGVPSSRLTLR